MHVSAVLMVLNSVFEALEGTTWRLLGARVGPVQRPPPETTRERTLVTERRSGATKSESTYVPASSVYILPM